MSPVGASVLISGITQLMSFINQLSTDYDTMKCKQIKTEIKIFYQSIAF